MSGRSAMWTAVTMVTLVFVTPHPASAEWQVKPFVGFTFGADTTILDLAHGADRSHSTYGVNALVLGEVFGVEAEASRVRGFFQGPASRNPDKLVLGSSLTTVTGNLIVAYPRRRSEYGLRPYAVIGTALVRAHTTASLNGLPVSDNMAAIDVGGGVTGFFNRRFGVNWDVRRFQTVGGYSLDLALLTAPPGEPLRQRLSFWRATIAVAIR